MSAPTATHIAELAPGWETTSYHEAGHAVAGVILDLPVHEVVLTYERRFLRWAVVGQTRVAPPGRTIDVDENTSLLFTTAGVAAEAIWLSYRDGHSIDKAWRVAEANPVNQAGDLAEIRACLPEATLTYADAQTWACDELLAAWDNIHAIADQLRATSYLGASQLARLV